MLRPARWEVSEQRLQSRLSPPLIGGVRRSFVTARGVQFHVTESGSRADDAVVVLALHGWPQHHYVYRDLLRQAPAGMRIVAPDLPGYGWSGPPPHSWGKEDVASDLLALMDEMRLRVPVILVGHDWGGYIAYRMALREPQRFGALLALNIAHPWISARAVAPHLWRILRYQSLVAAAGKPLMESTDFVRIAIEGALSDPESLTREQIAWYGERFRDPVCAQAAADTYRSFLLRELPRAAVRPETRRLQVPTLALFGLDDVALHHSLAAAETARADEYRLELVPGAGHFIVDERPDLVRERVISLAERVAPELNVVEAVTIDGG